jgi:hypothetical protein
MNWRFLIGVQMTEQQPKTPQIIDIVEMPPTQNGSQTPDTAQIEDILQMVDIQPVSEWSIFFRNVVSDWTVILCFDWSVVYELEISDWFLPHK